MFHSLILSRTEYALPVWGGYLNVEQTGQINTFYTDVVSTVFVTILLTLSNSIEKSDQRIFSAIQYPEHCTHTLLPPRTETGISLRPRGHNYQLPVVTRKQHHQSLITCLLYTSDAADE